MPCSDSCTQRGGWHGGGTARSLWGDSAGMGVHAGLAAKPRGDPKAGRHQRVPGAKLVGGVLSSAGSITAGLVGPACTWPVH